MSKIVALSQRVYRSVDRVAYPPHGDRRLSNIAPPGGQVGGNLWGASEMSIIATKFIDDVIRDVADA